MTPRRAARKDGTQDAIFEVWRRCGWHVEPTHWAGQYRPGFADGLMTRYPITVWVECKTGDGKVGQDQADFQRELDAPYLIERTVEDAQADAELWRERADRMKEAM